MKKIFINILLAAIAFPAMAQSGFETVLQTIEANNTTLQALKQQAEAQKLGNKTGIYLPNPEVEVNYLWGSPADMGNRTDVNVSQSFDFPTAYRYKSLIAKGRNTQADLEYAQQRKALLLQASMVCCDLVYRNALHEELQKRLQHAQQTAAAYQTKFERGDANILERNKANLNLLNAQKAFETNETERAARQAELVRMNGGKPLSFDEKTYAPYLIPENFEQWYATAKQNNPELQFMEQDVELSKQQEKLSRAMSLPKLSAGYMSERIAGTTLQGISVGVSIPLWENKNTVKHAKAQTTALQSVASDALLQFNNTLKIQYDKAVRLQKTASNYRTTLQSANNEELLKKALEQGQLSLIEYLMELSVYYAAVDNALEAERDCQYAIAELQQWEAR